MMSKEPMTVTVIDEQPVDEQRADEPKPLSIEAVEALLAATLPEPEASFPGDDTATWDYWSGLSNPTKGPSDELVWARLRYRRDQLLAACDFRMVTDAPWDTGPWETYRQALRDLPDTTSDPRRAVWPTSP